jgi:GNAT superfamily N-acetyltransferase
VRFERGVEPIKPATPAPAGLRFVDAAPEPEDRRRRFAAAAAAAYPGDALVLPALESLVAAEGGVLAVGFSGNDARVVAAGYVDGSALRLVTLYAAEVLRDHGAAEHLFARLADQARAQGLKRIVVESARPTARTVATVFRLGFRAVEAAAGFRLGPIPPRTPPHVFAV